MSTIKIFFFALEFRKQEFGNYFRSNKIKNTLYKKNLGLKPFIVGKGAPSKLNNDHFNYLLQILNQSESNFFLQGIAEKLKEEFKEFKTNPPFKYRYKIYKKKLRFSRKKGLGIFIDDNSEHKKTLEERVGF